MLSQLEEESLELSETQFKLINLDEVPPGKSSSGLKSSKSSSSSSSSSGKKPVRDRKPMDTEPELLLGLSYNGTTGRLQVFVLKGSQFRDMTATTASAASTTGSGPSQMVVAHSGTPSPPDTYVKLALISSSGQEISRTKTSIKKRQPNPVFKEKFVFQVALFMIQDVTLTISVCHKQFMKRPETIGWFSLGQHSSGEEESSHWNDMIDNQGEQICRWHVLLDPNTT